MGCPPGKGESADGDGDRIGAERLPDIELVFALRPGEIAVLYELIRCAENGHQSLLAGEEWEKFVSEIGFAISDFPPAASGNEHHYVVAGIG